MVRILIARSFVPLFLIFLFSSLALNIVSPVWSLYIKSLGASMAELGYVFTFSNGMAAILQIVSGVISDKYGRRKIHILGTCIAVFPPLLYTMATNWTDLIPGAILAGASASLYTPIRYSIVSDVSTIENRARAYSRTNVAYYAGFIMGPMVGGLIADIHNMKAPFFLSFLFSALCFPLSLSLQEIRMGSSTRGIRIDDDAEKAAAFPKVMSLFSFFYFVEGFGLGIFNPITPVFITKRFCVDMTFVGVLFTVGYGVAPFFLQIPGGWLSDRCDKRKVIIVSYLLCAPSYSLFAMSRNMWELFIFMSLSYGLMTMAWSAHQSLRMNLTPSSRWGFVNAISYATFWGGMTLGNALSGILWDNFGMFFPYCVSSVAILVSMFPMFFLDKD